MVEVTSLFSTCLSGNKVALAFGVGLCDNFLQINFYIFILVYVCRRASVFNSCGGRIAKLMVQVGPEAMAMFLLMMSANFYINISMHIDLYALLLVFFLSL